MMRSYLILLKLVRRYWIFLVVSLILSLLITVTMAGSFLTIVPFWSKIVEGDPFVPQISVPLPGYVQTMVDNFADWINNIPNQKLLFYLLFFVVICIVLRGLFQFICDVTLQFIGNSVVRNARSRLYAHLQNLSLDYFTEQKTGELMARITYDAEILHRGVADGFTRLFRNFFDLMLYLTLPIIIRWELSLLVFVIFGLIMPPVIIIGNIIKKLSSYSQEKIGTISSLLQETISGIRVVKAFSMESYETRRFDRHNRRFYRIMMRMARRDAILSPITEFVVMFAAAIVFVFMGRAMLSGDMGSGGVFILYLICLGSIPRPIKQIGKANNMIQRSSAAAERIKSVLNMKSSIVEKPGASDLPPFRNSVRFEDVDFTYNDNKLVLEGINLEVRRGEVLAIVGSSGSGKSTLVNLLPRFYDPTAGRLLIDGHDLRYLTLKSLRAQIGIVTQEVILFNDTVVKNIAYGMQGTSRDRIVEAARIANAHDFISRLPHGYDTIIGERGLMLSGGERQRLAIARAILKDPPILILDEATSALDAESERLVQEAIAWLMVERTVFVIAHRLSTIKDATRIIVLEDRKIVQMGSHTELLEIEGPYKKLYEMQFNI
ncbi:MAG: ABC transporter ATP-binding protein [Candidatus Euphemobacter frigidus]|nr:ABC transporter ATP-binding protein [Candidatus Euphemobacter frigidus]MDP8276219.1 ABC transporter ATP-binding protein [Candidatus Euphemobacter frigidus]